MRAIAAEIFPVPVRPWLLGGSLAYVAALAATGWRLGWALVAAGSLAAFAMGRPGVAAAAVIVTTAPFVTAPGALTEGPVHGQLTLATDPKVGAYGVSALGEADGVGVIARMDSPVGEMGDVLSFSGTVTGDTLEVGGRRRAVLEIDRAAVVEADRSWYQSAGLAVRHHVTVELSNGAESRSLLAGFLVGDTSGVGEVTLEEMRRAGLSHFVAVSGSNVALFLGFVAVVALPFGIGPRRRAAAGLVALPVFVVATGFEPSVVRAATMAALLLVGRLVGVGLDPWQVVSLATVAILGLDPEMARSVGFQLSLCATGGVMCGSRWPGGGAGRALRATLGAQLGVAPVLLSHFGSVPLLSPLANLLAAPLVAAATILGIAGVAGIGVALIPGEWVAGLVIWIARMASVWPQVGWMGLTLAVLTAVALHRVGRRHPVPVLVASAVALVAILVPRPVTLSAGEVAVLDVGQGDAILLSGGQGRYLLVDGGPDPALLLERLTGYGVRSLDVVVLTHGDADHAGGLIALPGRVAIGEVWERADPHTQPAGTDFLEVVEAYGIPVRQPAAGHRIRLGSLFIEVLGPRRRFASPNDQSIVLLAEGNKSSILLTGDVEVVGQAELPPINVDYLKVPHHGGGTSDPDWLGSTGASVAVVSVGENDFGHPVPWVIAVLERSGATVRRTDLEGTVVVDLGG